jgi:uncharacterized membrane protein
MPFCASCGSQVDGSFCAKCGARVGTAVPASGPRAQAAPEVLADNVASALCYVLGLITGIVFLVFPRYNRNPIVRFHAFQSIFLHVGCIVLAILLNIVLTILHLGSLDFLVSVMWLGFFILSIYLIIQTYQGKTIELPVIGPLARQQAGA